MPDDAPGTCKDQDAAAVAKYVYDSFYSVEARLRNTKPPRVELARLTNRQYLNSVADLLKGFTGSDAPLSDEHGLRAVYYNSSGFDGDKKVIERIDRAAALGDEAAEIENVFPTLPAVSIDHGVMEKAERVAVVDGSFGWSDVGSWQTSWELAEKDANGNAAPDSSVLVDARGNLVCDLRTERGQVIALVGVEDLAVVVTDDALLVIPRSRSQDVKKALDEVKRRAT